MSGDEFVKGWSYSRIRIQNCRRVEREPGKVRENYSKGKREFWEGKCEGFEKSEETLRREALRIPKGA